MHDRRNGVSCAIPAQIRETWTLLYPGRFLSWIAGIDQWNQSGTDMADDDELNKPLIEHDLAREARTLAERLRARRPQRGATFRQLYAEAQRRGIPGRSHMSKEELEQALAER